MYCTFPACPRHHNHNEKEKQNDPIQENTLVFLPGSHRGAAMSRAQLQMGGKDLVSTLRGTSFDLLCLRTYLVRTIGPRIAQELLSASARVPNSNIPRSPAESSDALRDHVRALQRIGFLSRLRRSPGNR